MGQVRRNRTTGGLLLFTPPVGRPPQGRDYPGAPEDGKQDQNIRDQLVLDNNESQYGRKWMLNHFEMTKLRHIVLTKDSQNVVPSVVSENEDIDTEPTFWIQATKRFQNDAELEARANSRLFAESVLDEMFALLEWEA